MLAICFCFTSHDAEQHFGARRGEPDISGAGATSEVHELDIATREALKQAAENHCSILISRHRES